MCVFVTTLDAAVMAKKHNTPFQSHHSVEFGLQICERSTGTTPTVVMKVGRFCELFRKKEAVVGSRCSCLDHFKYSNAPFLKEN